MKVLHEEKLFQPLKDYFNALGYKVYCEVPFFGRSIDFVAIKGEEQIAVEMKVGLNQDVIRQSYSNIHWWTRSYAAIGTKPMQRGLDTCEKNGIGVLRVTAEGVLVLLEGKVNENPIQTAWKQRPDFSKWEEGNESGRPQMKGEGATYAVIDNIKDYLKDHPNADWKEIAANVQHHYSSASSMSSSLSSWRGFSLMEAKKELKNNL